MLKTLMLCIKFYQLGSLFLISILATTLAVDAEEITGTVVVVNGDTVEMAGKSIHFFGVDAPEIEQKCRIYRLNWPCGKRSIVILQRLIAQRAIRCELVDTPTDIPNNQLFAHCYNHENLNLNAAIIGAGMAIPLLNETSRYVNAERHAQLQRIGLWSGRFIPPAEWRDGKRFRPLGKPLGKRKLKD